MMYGMTMVVLYLALYQTSQSLQINNKEMSVIVLWSYYQTMGITYYQLQQIYPTLVLHQMRTLFTPF